MALFGLLSGVAGKVFQLAKGGITALKNKKAAKKLAQAAQSTDSSNYAPLPKLLSPMPQIAQPVYQTLPDVTVHSSQQQSGQSVWEKIQNFQLPSINVNHEMDKSAKSATNNMALMIGGGIALLGMFLFLAKKK